MTTKLHDFMYRVHGAFPLPLATASITPGCLLETSWLWGFPIDSRPKFSRLEGPAWDLFDDIAETDYRSTMHDANILVGSITDRVEFGIDLPLAQLGLALGAGIKHERQATLTVGTVRARVFDRGFSGHELRRRLRSLRLSDPARWRWVDDDYLITECFYTGDLRFDFRGGGDVSARAAFEKAGVEISGSFTAKWSNDESLVLRGTAAVPFAVRGIKV